MGVVAVEALGVEAAVEAGVGFGVVVVVVVVVAVAGIVDENDWLLLFRCINVGNLGRLALIVGAGMSLATSGNGN